MIVDGVKMPHVRRCRCGKPAKISTSYPGLDPGTGPFIIACPDWKVLDAKFLAGVPRLKTRGCGFVRSWYKTRAVRLWRKLVGPARAA